MLHSSLMEIFTLVSCFDIVIKFSHPFDEKFRIFLRVQIKHLTLQFSIDKKAQGWAIFNVEVLLELSSTSNWINKKEVTGLHKIVKNNRRKLFCDAFVHMLADLKQSILWENYSGESYKKNLKLHFLKNRARFL